VAQIKVYGVKEHLDPVKARLSDVIHSCVVDALSFPRDKRAHRFFPLEAEEAPTDLEVTISETPKHNWVFVVNLETKWPSTTKSRFRSRFRRRPMARGISQSPASWSSKADSR
jgi:hypothetical protein